MPEGIIGMFVPGLKLMKTGPNPEVPLTASLGWLVYC